MFGRRHFRQSQPYFAETSLSLFCRFNTEYKNFCKKTSRNSVGFTTDRIMNLKNYCYVFLVYK